MPQYYYQRKPVWGGFSTSSVVTKIVLANVAVFILQHIFPVQVARLFALSPRMVVDQFYFWQPFTYMFLHYDLRHLLFNMFIIWIFGSALESVWGGRRLLNYYIICGLGGAAFSIIFTYDNMILGASAAGFGLMLAYAMLFPDNYLYIWFLFPVKAKYLVLFLAVLQFLPGIFGPTRIAYFAHLGGLVTGMLFFRREISAMRFFSRSRRTLRKYADKKTSEYDSQERQKVDSILDKIASKGYEDLSTTERRILENYSRKHKEDSD